MDEWLGPFFLHKGKLCKVDTEVNDMKDETAPDWIRSHDLQSWLVHLKLGIFTLHSQGAEATATMNALIWFLLHLPDLIFLFWV